MLMNKWQRDRWGRKQVIIPHVAAVTKKPNRLSLQ
jgi:hypothetical protein